MDVNRRETAQFTLFADWCSAVGVSSLPAAPLTLARFLDAHPAAPTTQRRRVTTINAAHRRSEHTPPGSAQAVRDLIDDRRRLRRREGSAQVAAVISQLPETGWPTALFARRDALLLVLAGEGLGARRVAELCLGDLRPAGYRGLLAVGQGADIVCVGGELARYRINAAQVWRRWDDVRRVQHHLPATRRVAHLLEGERIPRLDPAPAGLPLFTPLDRWGATPLRPTPLSAKSIGRIVADHLGGVAPAHPPLRRQVPAAEPEAPETPPEQPVPVLDPGSFSRGLEARRRAMEEMQGVDDALDDIEARADVLLHGLLELLEEPEQRRCG